MRRHPSPESLLGWLERGSPRRVGRHLDSCEECLDRLDALTTIDAELRTGLEVASAPPPDLVDRTAGGVQDRLAAEEAASLLVELLGLPWQTFAVLVDDTPAGVEVVDAGSAVSDDSQGTARPSARRSDDDGERSDG